MRCALLAEPHHQLSEGVRGLLAPTFEIIVMVADEASLLDALERMEATLAVVDLSLPPGQGLTVIGRVRRRFPEITLIAIGVHDDPGVARAIVAAGADRFVSKAALATDLLPAVDGALRPSDPARSGGRRAADA